MHIIFPDTIENLLRHLKLKFLPKTLFFRTMLLIFIPLIIVQVVSIIAYFDGSWGKVGRRLSDNLTSNMAFVMSLMEQNPSNFEQTQKLAKTFYNLEVVYIKNADKYNAMFQTVHNPKLVTGFVEESLRRAFPENQTHLYLSKDKTNIIAQIETSNGLYQFTSTTKNVFSSSLFGFILWMIGSSLLLFIVATLFLRIQARSIKELAESAEDFGKGINTPFAPYGSAEVRKAGLAFNKMKERINRQMAERTQMLAGISHDLRTPLTRMKLQLAMLESQPENQGFLEDISEMEQMLNGYLAFVRGEGTEEAGLIDLETLVSGLVEKFKINSPHITYSGAQKSVMIQGKKQALSRALSNVISNALYYGTQVWVSLKEHPHKVIITIEDNGPGIPEDKRQEVFKAFYRIEESRNKKTGGIGLGLAITKDIVLAHGGSINLAESKAGGLSVQIILPV